MRMRKRFEDEARPFQGAEPKHSGHIGPGPKPGAKRAVNLSVDAEILKLAKAMKINLSRALEDALRRLTEEEQARRFYEENKAFIDAHNAHVERYGTLTEAFYGRDAFDDPAV